MTPTRNRGWIRRLVEYCLRHKVVFFGSFLAALTASVVAAGIPLLLRRVVDDVTSHHAASVTPWVLLLLGLGLARFATSFLRRYTAGRLSLDVQYDMRNDVFHSLQALDGARQDELHTGQVVSRAISDVQLVQGLLQFLPNMAGNFLLFVVSLIVMLTLSPTLTVVALAIGPALAFIAYRSRRDLFPANWSSRQDAAEVVGDAEAAITGVRIVKGFGQEERELDKLDKRALTLFGSRMRVVKLTALYNPAMQAIPALGQVGVLALGGYLALRGNITIGTFLAFSAYLVQTVAPVRQLGSLLVIGQQARAGVDRVMEIVDSRPKITERPGARDLRGGAAALELDHVTFGYEDGRPVLHDVSLRVEPGESLALVGGSGSGKSTVVQLLPRFYDVTGGAVRVGGQDVRDVTFPSLRSGIGVVFEDSFLFSDTVRENISYGRPDATEEQIVAAARAAEADEFIRDLPHGYDTVVGEQGLTLSGGQRQRVALARAILTDPSVLLLDDATSAIDARVEQEIHATLRKLMRGRTTVLVAHRRSTLSLADRIAVLEEGRVVDVGTEDELRARCPLFRQLFLTGDGALTTRAHVEEDDGAWKHQAAAVRGGLGGVLASMSISPKLLERVKQLPPADDAPHVDPALSRAPAPNFSLVRLLRPFLTPFLAGLALVAADAVATLFVPALVRTGVDQGVQNHALQVVLWASLGALALALGDWVVTMAQTRITGRTGERVLYTLRIKTYAHLMRLGLDYYERELGGRIMTRMTTDIDALSNFLQTGLNTIMVSVLSVIGVVAALLLLNLDLALVLMAVLPVMLIATLLYRRVSVPAYREARERVSRVNAELQEKVAGVRVSQAFLREDRNEERFADMADGYRVSRMRAQTAISTFFPFIEFMSTVAMALVLAVGAAQVRGGTLTVGVLIAFLLYIDLFFSPIQQLSQVFDGYQQASVGLRRLQDLLRTPTSTPVARGARDVGRLRGEVELDAVRFAYRGADIEALAGVTLRVAAGETIALVGETGAGKSTVVKMIARFYDPTGGAVRVDGVDLRELDLAAYRRRLGVVPQEAHLLGETVRDAIAYGRPSASDEEVEAAARAVGAHDMVASLPLGYRTPVGERGRNLSSGQRQLIALARAELVDPDILLLDEATASLDLRSEAAVTRATAALATKRTTFVVAHRLSTAARADRIVVLAHGRIEEIGTHAELIRAGGEYSRLWEAFAGDEAA